MAEAIISRRGYNGSGGGGSNGGGGNNGGGISGYTFVTNVIQSNTNFTVPNDAFQNIFQVRAFGGGAGGVDGYNSYVPTTVSIGGCGGYMNNNSFILTPGERIRCYIGDGGTEGNSGGTTTFGTYLSANGGTISAGGSGGGGKVLAGYGYSGSEAYTHIESRMGGTGYQFGGGSPGGNGGPWGGGGAGCHMVLNTNTPMSGSASIQPMMINGGRGGTYGGNGGRVVLGSSNINRGNNGTNTMRDSNNVPNTSMQGPGLGSNGSDLEVQYNSYAYASGAGGGYGGNGGNVNKNVGFCYMTATVITQRVYGRFYGSCGGGGGGYGADGGDCLNGLCGAGGGGYGGRGGNGDQGIAGGGGGYGDGGSWNTSAGLGAGGAGGKNGGRGVILIEWYRRNS